MNDNNLMPIYDESLEIEMFFDFNGSQILRINTIDSGKLLEAGKTFYNEVKIRCSTLGKVKIIYLFDKVPAMTSVLGFINNKFPSEILWSAIAIIAPLDDPSMEKIIPVFKYSLNLTDLSGKYILDFFEHKYKYNLTDIYEWLEKSSAV